MRNRQLLFDGVKTRARGASHHKGLSIPSLIKWTGSKRAQAHEINSHFPPYNRYFEPFLGGGALLFLNCSKETIASDIYEPLIRLWVMIRDDVEQVIQTYTRHWQKLQKNLPDYFYQIRTRFNKEHDPQDLLFLSRTCVNGIVRFNSKGGFNNSFHLSRKGMTPERFARLARESSLLVKKVRFKCADYRLVLKEAKKGDLVYLDPPYSDSKNRYIANLDTKGFFDCLEQLNSKQVKFALSFDGKRNGVEMGTRPPKGLYKRRLLITNGNSAVKKVLDKKTQAVEESLYLSY